jgi:hypothetical protein
LIGGEWDDWIRFVGHRGSMCLCAAAGYSGHWRKSITWDATGVGGQSK